jgi:ATP-dependent Clp protease adapter protein ClpS
VATVDLPDVLTDEDVETDLDDNSLDNPWQAVLYNCDCHTYAQVIQQLMLAIGCSQDQAYELAWIVDHHGRASVYFGEKTECERVVGILRDIGLRAEVEQS